MADQDDRPLTSETVHLPQPPAAKREEINDRIRLQADQTEADRAKTLSRARPTQDWTPTYRDLLARASRQAALEGSRDEAVINRMLERPNPETPIDPRYRPPQEVIDADTRDQELREREAAVARRETELEIERLELQAQRMREGLEAGTEPPAQDRTTGSILGQPVNDVIPHTDVQRQYGDTDASHWAGRKRMTPEERAAAEREGIELFGLDVTANSAWSSLNDLDPQTTLAAPTAHQHRTGQDPAERIANIQAARARAVAENDAQGLAEAMAEATAFEEEQTAGPPMEDDYEKRQIEARAAVEAYMAAQRGDR